jgi:hypothetical protein
MQPFDRWPFRRFAALLELRPLRHVVRVTCSSSRATAPAGASAAIEQHAVQRVGDRWELFAVAMECQR